MVRFIEIDAIFFRRNIGTDLFLFAAVFYCFQSSQSAASSSGNALPQPRTISPVPRPAEVLVPPMPQDAEPAAETDPPLPSDAAPVAEDPAPPLPRDASPAAEDFPSKFVCPISHEPPSDGCTFDVELTNGDVSAQVFEMRNIFLHIATIGVGRARYDVKHPLHEGMCGRTMAMSKVHRVTAETQRILNQERSRLGLALGGVNAITHEDQTLMRAMLTTRNAR